jgi:hypothetical protein
VVHPNAMTVLGVVWAVGRRETQAVVCLHQRLAFGEQGEPPRFEFSFRHACPYALHRRASHQPADRSGLLTLQTLANGPSKDRVFARIIACWLPPAHLTATRGDLLPGFTAAVVRHRRNADRLPLSLRHHTGRPEHHRRGRGS